MKKTLSILLAVALIAILAAGCTTPAAPPASGGSSAPGASAPAGSAPGSSAPAPAPGKTFNDSKKIAGVVFQEDQFMKLLQMGYKDTATKGGYEFLPGNTNNDQGKEADLINTYVDQKIAALAISPISETASLPSIQQALDANIVVGLSNTLFDGEKRVVGAFSSDNYSLGKSTGEVAKKYITDKMGGKATVAIIQFKSLLPEQSGARSGGFIDQIKDMPGVTIKVDQDAWLQDKAITVVTDVLTANPDIDLIFAANEGGTIGATMAVQNAGKAGKIVVFGTDFSQQMSDLLQDDTNVLQAVTGQDPYKIGVDTMTAIVDYLGGKEITTMGQGVIVPGMLFVRGDNEKMNNYLADLKAKGV